MVSKSFRHFCKFYIQLVKGIQVYYSETLAITFSRGHYTLYNSLKNLSPTILNVFKFPGLFVRDFTKNIKNGLAQYRLEPATS